MAYLQWGNFMVYLHKQFFLNIIYPSNLVLYHETCFSEYFQIQILETIHWNIYQIFIYFNFTFLLYEFIIYVVVQT